MSEQMSLLTAGQLVDSSIKKVFGVKEIKNSKQEIIGERVIMGKRKEIVQELGLVEAEKDVQDAAILEHRDKAGQRARAAIAGLDSNWTLKKFETKVGGPKNSRTRRVVVEFEEIVRKKGDVTDKQIADAYGVSLEEAAKIRTDMLAKVAALKASTDVQGEVLPDEQATANKDAAEANPEPAKGNTAQTMTDEELEKATAPAPAA